MYKVYKYYIFFFFSLFLIGCNQKANEILYPSQIIELNQNKTNQLRQYKIREINFPTIATIFANDLDYDKYEKAHAKEEYYNLTDFQGYFTQFIVPFINEKKIQVVDIVNRDTVLSFKIDNGDVFYFELKTLNYKQGLVLYNGKNKPVFWNGKNSEGQLIEFAKSYFK